MAASEKYKATKNNQESEDMQESMSPEQAENARSDANNQQAAQAAIKVAKNAGGWVGAAATAADKIDKMSDGKLTEAAGKVVTKVNKIAPGGRQVQNALNKGVESGAAETVGNVADAKSGSKSSSNGKEIAKAAAKSKTTTTSSSTASGSASGGSTQTNGGFKIVAIVAIATLLPLMMFVTVFAEQEAINQKLTNIVKPNNSESSGEGGQLLGNVVYYNQKNYKNSYGYGETIAAAGCGPTAMAMVISTLTGNAVTPVDTADWSLNRGYRVESGTSWNFFPAIANEYGISCENISLDADSIINSLNQGKLIILSVKPNTTFAPFSSGHFIVLTGVDSEGKIGVADPYNEEANKLTYFIETFVNDGRTGGIWAFSK